MNITVRCDLIGACKTQGTTIGILRKYVNSAKGEIRVSENRTLGMRRCITGEGLQSLGLRSALKAFEQEGIFILPRGLGFSGLIRRTAQFSRVLRHTRRCWESFLTLIFTCPLSVAS
jgi:hypothetical protein